MFRYLANGSFIMKENFSQYTELTPEEFKLKQSQKKIRLSTKPINQCLKFTRGVCNRFETSKKCTTDEYGFAKCDYNPKCIKPDAFQKTETKSSCLNDGPLCTQICYDTKRKDCHLSEYNKGRCCPINSEVIKHNNKFYCLNKNL